MAPSTSEQDQEPEQDRERQADEEHLHLRHQPRQHAEPEIEQQAEHEERRRELDADAERGRDGAGRQRRDIAEQRHLARLEQRVAVVERGDHEMMQVGREDQRHAEDGEEIADDARPAGPCVGSTAVTKPSPSCCAMTEPATCSAEIVSRAVSPSTAPTNSSCAQQREHRAERPQVDRIGVAMQRQQHRGEHQRDGQPHAAPARSVRRAPAAASPSCRCAQRPA